jgi:hypothetical protein
VGSIDSLDFREEKDLLSLLGFNPQIVQPIAWKFHGNNIESGL